MSRWVIEAKSPRGEWREVAEVPKERAKHLTPEDLEGVEAGYTYRFVKVSSFLGRVRKKVIWSYKVPPSPKRGRESEEELDVNKVIVTLLQKVAENADFSGLKIQELTLPSVAGLQIKFGTGMPTNKTVVKVGDSQFVMDGIGSLEFDGKLPWWLHPVAQTFVAQSVANALSVVKDILLGKGEGKAAESIEEFIKKEEKKEKEEVPSAADELEKLIEESEKGEEVEGEQQVEKIEEGAEKEEKEKKEEKEVETTEVV